MKNTVKSKGQSLVIDEMERRNSFMKWKVVNKAVENTDDGIICQSDAAELINITVERFKKLGLKPCKTRKNPHCSSRPILLYNRAEVLELKNHSEYKAKRNEPRKSIDYAALYEKRYSSKSAEEILKEGCDALFSLNRYCKYPQCSYSNKQEIYGLKNLFIELLYHRGYCINVKLHIQEIPEKICYRCDGTGFDKYDYCECEKCGGSGIYEEAGTIEYYVLYFRVNEQNYTWHQPRSMASFVDMKIDDSEPINETTIKPIETSLSSLYRSKKLLRWIINREDILTPQIE